MSFRGLFTVLAAALFASGCAATQAPPPPAPFTPLPPRSAAPSAPVASDPPAPADVAAAEEASPVDEKSDSIDDDTDEDNGGARKPSARSPALDLDDAAFAKALHEDPLSLGSMSVGKPSAGVLVNGVQMPEGPYWKLIDPARAWGTKESIDAIEKAITKVNEQFPIGTPPVSIGHVSAKNGGYLSPHKSHQAGRDVDIGYYYTNTNAWFARATAQNLDKPRTWALVKAFAQSDVDMIFIDSSIQKILRDYALANGEDKDFVDRVFQVGSHQQRTIVRHIPGHATHLHVRFASPMACDVGARAEPFFKAELNKAIAQKAAQQAKEMHAVRTKEAPNDKKQSPPFFEHRVRDGDTLYRLAQHYGVTVEAIQKANGLKGNALKPKMVLKIPKG